jgi:hypothetical protein
MEYLREHNLDKVIADLKQPVLGICIGQQLLCQHSEEGDTDCIGIFPINVRRFQPTCHEQKVPAMGWNAIHDLKSPLFKGLNENDMVVLSGAHSIGRSSCNSFSDRLPPAANSSTAMEPILAADLTNTCSAGSVNVPQDFRTADTLDIQYYKNVLSRDVLFNSDASLTTSLLTNGWVDFYAGNRPSFLGKYLAPFVWHNDFGEAMVKMGNIGVKTGPPEGEIRSKCWSVNNP